MSLESDCISLGRSSMCLCFQFPDDITEHFEFQVTWYLKYRVREVSKYVKYFFDVCYSLPDDISEQFEVTW